MNPPVLAPLFRAAIGYANIIASLSAEEVLGGYDDNWLEVRRRHINGPGERFRVVQAALSMCQAVRMYNSIDQFERALGALLRAAGIAYDAPEGKVWRRRDEHSAWYLSDEGEPITETPGVWSPRRLDTGKIIVPAVVGVTFDTTLDALSAADTLRRRCMVGHGNPQGATFADRLDAVTA